jgi:hypothetical protein
LDPYAGGSKPYRHSVAMGLCAELSPITKTVFLKSEKVN